MSVGAWQPLWIGASPRRLYGALHGAPASSHAVLMAPPLLHEQPRSRRMLVEVASRIADAGLPCLRFDYYGTGDSDGSGDEHDFAQVARDLDAACATLVEATGATRIVVFAWRAALLPVSAWSSVDGRIAALAAWEPIVDGKAWLAALQATDRAERRRRYGEAAAPDDGLLLGLDVSPRWCADLASSHVAHESRVPLWSFDRIDVHSGLAVRQRFQLPPDAPRFGDETSVEDTIFHARSLGVVVDEFARLARAA